MVTTLTEVGTAAELAALIAGRSDREIAEMTAAAGVDAVLDRVFTSMGENFDTDKAAGHSARTQWEVETPGGTHTYHVDIDSGRCQIGPGAAQDPRVTLAMSLPNFLRFIAGEFDGMAGYMTGKLKVTGDVMFGPIMEACFRR